MTIKIVSAIVVGLVIFAIGSTRAGTDLMSMVRHGIWLAPWLGGHLVLGALGRYGGGAHDVLPEWVDIATVIVFSLVIFSWAVSLRLSPEQVGRQVERDAHQLDYEHAAA